jgi:trans-aconitate methyltransferase
VGGQFHWNPDEYRALMRAEVPGTGETAARVLAAHPRAHLLGVDSSEPMLGVARDAQARATLRVGMEDPLPPGPFDLCVSRP